MWKVPTVQKIDYKPVSEMNFGTTFHYTDNQSIPPISNQELNHLMCKIEKIGSTCALMRIIEPFASHIASQVPLESSIDNPYASLYQEEFQAYSLVELVSIGFSLNISIAEDDCLKVQEATVSQSLCESWFQQRIGRITASNFKKATRTSLDKPSLSLIKQICYPLNSIFKTAATEWGKNMKKMGYKLMKMSKKCFMITLLSNQLGSA